MIADPGFIQFAKSGLIARFEGPDGKWCLDFHVSNLDKFD
jgi:hypothetical protein